MNRARWMYLTTKAVAFATALLLAGGAAAQEPQTTTLRARGAIVSFDAETHVLTLNTRHGVKQFKVAATTQIREGGREITPADLPKLVGRHARVRHPDSSDTATSIDVSHRGEEEPLN